MWNKYLDCWLDFPFFFPGSSDLFLCVHFTPESQKVFLECRFPGSELYLLYTQFFPFPCKVSMTWPTRIVSILCFLPIWCIQTLCKYKIQTVSCHTTIQWQISAIGLGLTPSWSYHCISKLYFLAFGSAYVYFTFLLVWKVINKNNNFLIGIWISCIHTTKSI